MKWRCNRCGDITTEKKHNEPRIIDGTPMPESGHGCWKCFKGTREPVKKIRRERCLKKI